MAVTTKVLIESKTAETAQTTQYTATNCTARIDHFTATNTSSGNVTISVNLVPSGSSAGTTNLVVKTRSIAPNECYTFPELTGATLANGDFISTLTSSNVLTIRANGVEIT